MTEISDALDLEPGVFTYGDPRLIAKSLKRSAESSRRRKSGPFQSAMSMLTFYINRAGGQLSKARRARLEAAKDELRRLFGKPRARPGGSRPGAAAPAGAQQPSFEAAAARVRGRPVGRDPDRKARK